MTNGSIKQHSAPSTHLRSYEDWPLAQLVAAVPSDPLAHDEFHNHRTVFTSISGNQLLFIEKVDELCTPSRLRAYGVIGGEMCDRVRDELCDRFTLRFGGGHGGPEARRNFERIDAQIKRWRREHRSVTELEIERAAVEIVNRVLARHFLYAVRTGLRTRSPARSRYRWVVPIIVSGRTDPHGDGCNPLNADSRSRHNSRDSRLETETADSINASDRCAAVRTSISGIHSGRASQVISGRASGGGGVGVIEVWMPRSLCGSQRRQWLGDHIPDPDPTRPNEAQRVQSVIDRLLGPRHLVPLDVQADDVRIEAAILQELLAAEIEHRSLAEMVGDEKAHRLHELRPSIRRLGRRGVRRLVKTVFERVAAEDYHDGRVAEAFGLSAAAMSRFAGSRWKPGDGRDVPDLWANLAGVLLEHPGFRSLLVETRLLDMVAQVHPSSEGAC